MKSKKILKRISIVVLVAVVGTALYFYLGFFGNPISKILCRNAAEKYVEENYSDCYVDRHGYNFKDGSYFAHITNDNSVDTSFFVYTDWLGNIIRDSYESYVLSGHNTSNRMMMEYRDLLDKAMPENSMDFGIDIYYGDYLTTGSYEKYIYDELEGNIVAMPEEEIIIDKEYDYKRLSYQYGHVVLYAMDEDVSVKRAAEILIAVKEKLNESDMGFYSIDFVLHKPRKEDGKPNDDEARVNIDYFLYDDIYEENLEARVQFAHDDLTAYYERMDAIKKQEINGEI